MTPKQTLRDEMLGRRASISSAEAADAAASASTRLLGLDRMEGAKSVGLYASARGELDTSDLAHELIARGIALAYPRVVGVGQPLAFHRVADPTAMSEGTFGILEPDEHLGLIDPNELDVIVIPGLAFDRRGGRLGWGRGYYDMTLAGASHPLRIGYAYHAQLVEIVPTSAGDVAMDCVITEAGVHVCGPART